MSLHSDLNAMQAKLHNVEREQKLVRKLIKETLDAQKRAQGLMAEFHAGAAAMINTYGPSHGLTDDQIQPLSGNEGKEDPAP
jgi:hypothetical protein